MRIERIPLTHSHKLANDYIQGSTTASIHYDGLAQEPSAWESRIAYLADKPLSADRAQLVAALSAYNRRIGNHPKAMQHIEQLRSVDTLVIVGGQQSGLFSGPILVIYKAITIIQQAREATIRYGRPVIPVFWIAGEDHDFAEVDHVDLPRGDSGIDRLQLARREQERISISHLPIAAEEWEEALRDLTARLPDTDYKSDYIRKLRDICAESHTLSDAFARIMAWLFGEEGLILLDSADPNVRQIASPMWAQLIRNNEQLGQAYSEGKRRLEASGYTAQADVYEDGANLFYYHHGERLLLYRDGDDYLDRHDQVRMTKDQLLRESEQDPTKLSNNVLTRPLMQDYLLPVLSVVLGPGEIAYWGQVKEAFHTLHMRMPILVPRSGYTLLEPTDQKVLTRYELTVEEALHNLSSRRDAWLKSQETFDVETEFAEVEEAIRQLYAPLMERAASINLVMGQLGETNLARILDQVRYYQKRVQKEITSKHEVGLRQFDRLARSIIPGGVPQERVYNVFSYLNRYGDGWLRHLLHEHRPDPYDYRYHYICYL